MQIKIFDVEHGFCAYLIADNGNVIMIDCGHNSSTGFRPSYYLQRTGCTAIERFIVSNYDGDHLSDLPNLYANIPIKILHRNTSLSTSELKRIKLKGGPLHPGVEVLLQMMDRYVGEVSNPPYYPDLNFEIFWNSYPFFDDTNNLSLVTFLRYKDTDIIIPGDLERNGWLKLLENSLFVQRLAKVKIFVASHHGRESGYCSEVFDICDPYIVIVSDGAVQYDTQKDLYSKHSSGVNFPDGKRYVLTTRRDGHITISQTIGSVNISCSKYL